MTRSHGHTVSLSDRRPAHPVASSYYGYTTVPRPSPPSLARKSVVRLRAMDFLARFALEAPNPYREKAFSRACRRFGAEGLIVPDRPPDTSHLYPRGGIL